MYTSAMLVNMCTGARSQSPARFPGRSWTSLRECADFPEYLYNYSFTSEGASRVHSSVCADLPEWSVYLENWSPRRAFTLQYTPFVYSYTIHRVGEKTLKHRPQIRGEGGRSLFINLFPRFHTKYCTCGPLLSDCTSMRAELLFGKSGSSLSSYECTSHWHMSNVHSLYSL